MPLLQQCMYLQVCTNPSYLSGMNQCHCMKYISRGFANGCGKTRVRMSIYTHRIHAAEKLCLHHVAVHYLRHPLNILPTTKFTRTA